MRHTRLSDGGLEGLSGGSARVKLLLPCPLGLCVLELGLGRKQVCFGLTHGVLCIFGIKTSENGSHLHKIADVDIALSDLTALSEAEAGLDARPNLSDKRPVRILGIE
ncbi:hypothetical protein [Rhizobium tibeticum]|uniref:hypothetical protein n=1 Tax=Rhizobium tibeticum TaxID=501024 RepID=UPI001FCDAC23|nr:hypothetical protein [Rhizobium tibeticum]